MKVITSVTIDPELLSLAKAKKVNLSQLLESALRLELELESSEKQDEVTQLRKQNLELAKQLTQLAQEREALANRVSELERELAKLKASHEELKRTKRVIRL